MVLQSPSFCGIYHKAFLLLRQSILLFLTVVLGACSLPQLGEKNVVGVVAVNDPKIAKVGQDMLNAGGNAADAMTAMLFSGGVILPSRMGLGAGGVCQILDPTDGRVKTLNFLSRPMSFDRQIAVLGLPRGAYALQNKYGSKPWPEVVKNAKSLAENGVSVSELLSKDILSARGLNASWKKLKKGDLLKQPALAKTLGSISVSGAGILYNGALAQSIVSQSDQIIQEDLKNFKASFMDSIDVSGSDGKTFFPNPSVLSSDAYMIWRGAKSNKEARQTEAIKSMQKLEDTIVPIDSRVQGMGLIAADKSGLVIACSVSMGRPFGTRQLTEQGFYLGAVIPHQDTPSVYANFIKTNPDVTDVQDALVGVGNYALVDGLNEWALHSNGAYLLKGVGTTEDRLDDKRSFAGLVCEKGYPNQVGSCQENENTYFVEQKSN